MAVKRSRYALFILTAFLLLPSVVRADASASEFFREVCPAGEQEFLCSDLAGQTYGTEPLALCMQYRDNAHYELRSTLGHMRRYCLLATAEEKLQEKGAPISEVNAINAEKNPESRALVSRVAATGAAVILLAVSAFLSLWRLRGRKP